MDISYTCSVEDEVKLNDYLKFHYIFRVEGSPIGFAKIVYYPSKNEFLWDKFEPLKSQPQLKYTGIGTKCHCLILSDLARKPFITAKTIVSHIPKATSKDRISHLSRMGIQYTEKYTFEEYLRLSINYATKRNYI